jgi:hypothetical protein
MVVEVKRIQLISWAKADVVRLCLDIPPAIKYPRR